MTLPADLVAYLRTAFPQDVQDQVLTALESAVLHDGTTPEARLLRCAAVASRGDLARLHGYIADLRTDYRDVIVEGEYELVDGKLKRVRDLSGPIAAGLR